MNSQSVNIQWTFAELGEYISNTSAYVAKTLAQGADGVVFDTFTITEDEHAAFLNDKIEEALLAVTPFFNRITPDESSPILPTTPSDNVGISFVPRIEGGEYSQTDFAFVESLTKKYIASYILFEWYSIKGVATMMQYFGGQRELVGSNLRDRLFRFVRPSRKSGITIRKVYGTRCDKTATTKVNNRSDFVLVWGSSDGSPLPEFNYDIVFYTEDNGLQYTVQAHSDNYKPIVGEDGVIRKAKIVFDLNGEYFPNGVLKYEMSGNVPDTDFPEGRRYFEQVGETNIEIWDGATDAQRAMDVAFLPAFINVRFEDLTPEEIAILQGPANSAASNANLAANRATNAAQEAEVATQTLISKADYAAAKGKEAELAAINASERIIEINSTNESIKVAEIKREEAEKKREGSWSNLSSAVNSAILSAYQSVSDANKATREATSAAESATSAKQEIEGFFNEVSVLEAVRQEKEARRITDEEERISHENERVSAENMRIEAENARVVAETKREENEEVRSNEENQRQTNETNRVAAENKRVVAESNRQKDTSVAILNAHQAADSANEAAESANEAREGIAEALGKKADINGTYQQMTVGFAQDIVGDGSATPEEFSFRPTAGEDRNVANTTYYEGERNGVARIEKVKGNSVGWNQKMTHLRPTYVDENGKTTYIDSFPITINGITFNRNIDGSYSVKGTATAQAQILFENPTTMSLQGHRYYTHGFKSSKENFLFFGALSTGLRDYLGIFTQKAVDSNFNFSIRVYEGATVDDTAHLYVVDLTQMSGAGNEPTTIEEFYQRLPKGVDINAYNKGELVDGNYGAIKTVGFNAFNGTYAKVCGGCPYYLGGNYTSLGFATEEGGTTEAITLPTSTESVGTTPSDRLYTPTQNGYIYADGENININLSWDTEYGYLNGTYQPYKPFERDLSWVKKYFPNGMRSAVSARDEIRFNYTTQKWEAVQNVGVRDLGSLNWQRLDSGSFNTKSSVPIADLKAPSSSYINNSICSNYIVVPQTNYEATSTCLSVFTSGRLWLKDSKYTDVDSLKAALQGVMFNYELAKPIVNEIEEMPNMDFDVSDYGTEELIVAEGAQSAPIVADIVYEPNALNAIKQVPDILKRLKALESALAQQTTNVEPSNIEE